MAKHQLPLLADLFSDPAEAFKNDQFNTLLNQEPPASWVKTHPTIPGNWQYLPIDKVEYLLVKMFGGFEREIRNIDVKLNSCVAVVRVIVTHPVTGEKIFNDGVGASPIQLDSGSPSPLHFERMKAGALQMAAPSSASYALSNACEKFGRLFGRDLNRKNTTSFNPMFPNAEFTTDPPKTAAAAPAQPTTPVSNSAPTPTYQPGSSQNNDTAEAVYVPAQIAKPVEEGEVIEWN